MSAPPAVNGIAYLLALRGLARQKKFIFAIIVSLLPLVGGLLGMLEDIDRVTWGLGWHDNLTGMTSILIVAVTLPLMSLLLAGGMIADEAEERTLSYLLVRPVHRSTLYLSRSLAVLTIALPLALLQALGLWMARYFAYLRYAPAGTRVQIGATELDTIPMSSYMLDLLPGMIGAALLGSVFYCLLFGLSSLASTRYHFFINLGYVGLWEGFVGHAPANAQRLTATHQLGSILDLQDPVNNVVYPVLPTAVWFATLALLVVGSLALLCSMWVVRRRDFHVSSAAT